LTSRRLITWIFVTLLWSCKLKLSPTLTRAHVLFFRLSTLNFWFFLPTYQYFEKPGHAADFELPSAACILSQCSHFAEDEAKHLFCHLVATLFRGPQPPAKAWSFAEHLLKTHAFFAPLWKEATPTQHDARAPPGDTVAESFSPSDVIVASDHEHVSVSTKFAGVDPNPNSHFQRVFADLDKWHRQPPHRPLDAQRLLAEILSDVRESNSANLSEKIKFGALEVLLRALHSPRCNFAIARRVLSIVFQILDSCPNQRHVLMQITDVERETGESLLQYLVKFVSSGESSAPLDADAVASVADIKAAALSCIKSAVACSIPYRSLSDFPDVGCYGSPKMGSMLTCNVLHSIVTAIEDELTSEVVAHSQQNSDCFSQTVSSRVHARLWRSEEVAEKVLQAFFQDSELSASYFSGNRSALRAMVQEDHTVQEFRRLNAV
jgi:hypothetical protein